MCGLALCASLNGVPLGPGSAGVVEQMVRTVAHRGPDEQTYFTHPQARLGFTRLSLIDPNDGSQPFVTTDDSVALVANGEVYNHRTLVHNLRSGAAMKTGSDCEVLLHLYLERGREFLKDVNGMLAVMIVDVRRHKVILARDRFGIKPLYFHRNAERIVAASEIKALFCDPQTPREVDWEGALGSVTFSAAPMISPEQNLTWFTGIETVEPGTVVEIDMRDGSTRVHAYWELELEPDFQRSAADFINDYRELLRESVHDCASADVEVGLFLSGGIDSASVAAFAKDVAPIHTFTALNPGTFANGDSSSAHAVASFLGLPNHQAFFDPNRVPTGEEWRNLVWQVESPVCGPEVYYKHELHRFARSVRPGVKAMMLGAASDEFNGGYSVDISQGSSWKDFDAELHSQRLNGGRLTHPRSTLWLDRGGSPWLTDEALGLAGDTYSEYLRAEWRKIWQYNVWHEDRTAAGSSIEARVPFLDHRLVELVVSIPAALRPELLWDKRILREAMRRHLPERIIEREKVAFFYGAGLPTVYRTFLTMLQQDSAELVVHALEQPLTSRVLRRDVVLGLLKDLDDRAGSAEVEVLLTMVNLGLLEAMTADIPRPRVDLPSTAVPSEWLMDSWTASAAAMASELGIGIEPLLGRLCALSPQVLITEDVMSRETHFLIMNGEIQYVLDEDSPDGWLTLLTTADGSCTLAELLERAGVSLATVREALGEAVSSGILVFGARPPVSTTASPQDTIARSRTLDPTKV